jgi:hypothetical protein
MKRKNSLASKLTTSKETKMACSLHKLPPELREEIFKQQLVHWDGKTPCLIKALRPDKKLYTQALGIFFRHNAFTFHKENNWSFGDMTQAAVLSIERVKISIEYVLLIYYALIAE